MTVPGQMLNVASMVQIATIPPIIVISNEQSQGLRVDWTVDKSATPAPDTATVEITNLGLVQRKAIEAFVAQSPVPLTVQLFVGWGMIPELLFTGQVHRARPEIRRESTTTITELELGDGALPTRDTPPSGGVWVGQTAAVKAQLLLTELGYVPSPTALGVIAERAAALPISAWQDVSDRPQRRQLDDLMATLGLTWGVQDGFFVVYRNGLRNDLLPSILAPQSGLIEAHPIDDGVEFEALAQPRFVPGLQIQVFVPIPRSSPATRLLGGGPLRVESVSFRGNSEGPSTMRGTAKRVQIL